MSASRDAGIYLEAYQAAFTAVWRLGGDIDAVREEAEARAVAWVGSRRNKRARRRLCVPQERTQRT